MQRCQFSAQDEAEIEEFIRLTYIGNRTRLHGIRDGARFTASVAEADVIGTDLIRATVDYSTTTDPFGYFISLAVFNGQLRIRSSREETIVPAGETTFYPLGVPLDIDANDLGVRTLRLPIERLAAEAEQTAGIAAADLCFDAITPGSAIMGRRWTALVNLAGPMLLEQGSLSDSPLLAEELTRTAAITALHTFPNTALTVAYQPGPGWVTPAVVRRAAAFMQSHAGQPLTVDQIAATAGISTRALRAAFRRHYDITPTGYLRRIRLERADLELRAAHPDSGLTVAAVAHRWGWPGPRQFTAAYQRRFGVRPSHTLRM